MSDYDKECLVTGENSCVCTKPKDAETARYEDSDAPCDDGCK